MNTQAKEFKGTPFRADISLTLNWHYVQEDDLNYTIGNFKGQKIAQLCPLGDNYISLEESVYTPGVAWYNIPVQLTMNQHRKKVGPGNFAVRGDK